MLRCTGDVRSGSVVHVIYDQSGIIGAIEHVAGNVLGDISRPAFGDVESDNPPGVSILSRNEIANDRFAVRFSSIRLETTARYTRVATGIIAKIESPLDGLSAPRRRRARRHPEEPAAP